MTTRALPPETPAGADRVPLLVPVSSRVLRKAQGVALCIALGAALSFGVGGCDSGADGGDGAATGWPAIALDPTVTPPQKLSATGLARRVQGALQLHPDLVPYDLTMPLFSDYAEKRRALWVPKGKVITWRDDGPLEFPEGSILVKSFLFSEDMRDPGAGAGPRVIETRVMVKGATDWKAWPYIWDAEGGDATLAVNGAVKEIAFVDPAGTSRVANYLIPQRNQCLDCHDQGVDGEQVTGIIGPRARYLHRDGVYGGKTINQLQHLHDLGLLPAMPALTTLKPATSLDEVRKVGVPNLHGPALESAARDYLEVNCAHCHSAKGVEGRTSQLFLDAKNDNPFLYGVCKAPSSAGKGGFGRQYDVVPGHPDKSILVYRLETAELGAMMPDIGRSLPDTLGIALVRKWIEALPPVNCDR